MSTGSESTSEDLTPELLDSLRPYASADELQLLEAELAARKPQAVETIAKTRAEAARLIGVDERTISKWQTDPQFPGRPGDPGQANGHYPIEKIQAWREATRRGATSDQAEALAALRQRKLAADTRKREVELRRLTGDLISLADAQAVIVDAVNAARSQLEAWPSKVVDQIPPRRAKLRRWLMRMAEREVRQVLRGLEDALNGGGDGDSDGGPDLSHRTKAGSRKAARRDP